MAWICATECRLFAWAGAGNRGGAIERAILKTSKAGGFVWLSSPWGDAAAWGQERGFSRGIPGQGQDKGFQNKGFNSGGNHER